jgi:archaellum component FlaF (FlaF/FlaG flagellin family)
VATPEIFKFVLRIENKSDKIILYKPEESTLITNGKEIKPVEKWLIIFPVDNDYRTVNFKGAGFQQPQFSYKAEGLYTVSEYENPVEAPEFMLPPSKNDFKAGNFSCNMVNLSKESDKTTVKFECRYTGSKIGVINPGRAAVKLPDGTEIANAKSNSKSEILFPGDTKKITLGWNRMAGGRATDMQLIKMQILWRDTFVEAEPQKIAGPVIEAKMDPVKSK